MLWLLSSCSNHLKFFCLVSDLIKNAIILSIITKSINNLHINTYIFLVKWYSCSWIQSSFAFMILIKTPLRVDVSFVVVLFTLLIHRFYSIVMTISQRICLYMTCASFVFSYWLFRSILKKHTCTPTYNMLSNFKYNHNLKSRIRQLNKRKEWFFLIVNQFLFFLYTYFIVLTGTSSRQLRHELYTTCLILWCHERVLYEQYRTCLEEKKQVKCIQASRIGIMDIKFLIYCLFVFIEDLNIHGIRLCS